MDKSVAIALEVLGTLGMVSALVSVSGSCLSEVVAGFIFGGILLFAGVSIGVGLLRAKPQQSSPGFDF